MEAMTSLSLEDVKSTLESTFNMSQMSNMFQNMVMVINDQGEEIKKLKSKFLIFEHQQKELVDQFGIDFIAMKSRIDSLQEGIDNRSEPSTSRTESTVDSEPSKMNLFDVSAAAPRLAQHRKSIQYFESISELQNQNAAQPGIKNFFETSTPNINTNKITNNPYGNVNDEQDDNMNYPVLNLDTVADFQKAFSNPSIVLDNAKTSQHTPAGNSNNTNKSSPDVSTRVGVESKRASPYTTQPNSARKGDVVNISSNGNTDTKTLRTFMNKDPSWIENGEKADQLGNIATGAMDTSNHPYHYIGSGNVTAGGSRAHSSQSTRRPSNPTSNRVTNSREKGDHQETTTTTTASANNNDTSTSSSSSSSSNRNGNTNSKKNLHRTLPTFNWWNSLNDERKSKILTELKIRGEFIISTRLLSEGGQNKHRNFDPEKQSHVKKDTIEVYTDSIHQRLISVERELVDLYSKFQIQNKQIQSLPNSIRDLWFSNMSPALFTENMKTLNALLQQLESVGGVSAIIQNIQNQNNTKENVNEVLSNQIQFKNDIHQLKVSLHNIDKKADNALIDTNTLSSIFGLPLSSENQQQSSSPSQHDDDDDDGGGSHTNSRREPSSKQLSDAKVRFTLATWDSISQLNTNTYPAATTSSSSNSGSNNNIHSRPGSASATGGGGGGKVNTVTNSSSSSSPITSSSLENEKEKVLKGLKDYLLHDINHQELPTIKADIQKLEKQTKIIMQQELIKLKNLLMTQDDRTKDKISQIDLNHNMLKNEFEYQLSNANSRSGDGLSEQEFSILAENVKRITLEQASAIGNMVKDLKRLEEEMSEKPSVDSMEHMIRIIENTFKRQLGENVVGLKVTVGQVIKAVQQKASKDEVLKLVAMRLSAMEESVNDIVHDEHILAGSLKCISCGSNYAQIPSSTSHLNHGTNILNKSGTGNSMLIRPLTTPVHGSGSHQSSSRRGLSTGYGRNIINHGLPSTNDTLDDAGDNHHHRREPTTPALEKLTIGLDYVPSFGGNGTLKPILTQSQPDEPILHPFATTGENNNNNNRPYTTQQQQQQQQQQRPRRGVAIAQEPLYRKARLANTMKEFVKPSTANSTVGRSPPHYVMNNNNNNNNNDYSAHQYMASTNGYNMKINNNNNSNINRRSNNVEDAIGGQIYQQDDYTKSQSASEGGGRGGDRMNDDDDDDDEGGGGGLYFE